MGSIGEIPYLKEMARYLVKSLALFVVLGMLLTDIGLRDTGLLVIFCLFAGFPMKAQYYFVFISTYAIFYCLNLFTAPEFLKLFVYAANVAINTLAIMLQINRSLEDAHD